MEYDINMFDVEKGIAMKANSSNLNEELGQISFVFSDKTGTLTRNVMEFKKFTAGNGSYDVE
jgi:phospholipid-transporting ATPase